MKKTPAKSKKATKKAVALKKKTKKVKELYSAKEIATIYGKDESQVRRKIRESKIETVSAISKEKTHVQAITTKSLAALVKDLKWREVSFSKSEITVTEAMRSCGLNVENQRKTFIGKLVALGIKTIIKSTGKGKDQPCLDKKHLPALKKAFDLPRV